MVKLQDIVTGYAQQLEEEEEEEFSNISDFIKQKVEEEQEEQFFNIEKAKTICKNNWMIAIILAVILYMVSRI